MTKCKWTLTSSTFFRTLYNLSHELFITSSAVHGSSSAAPHASEAPAWPGVPAPRAPEEGPPLHLHPGALSGSAPDPQVHSGCHHLPSHGKVRVFILSLLLAKIKTKIQTLFLFIFYVVMSFVKKSKGVWLCFSNLSSLKNLLSSTCTKIW